MVSELIAFGTQIYAVYSDIWAWLFTKYTLIETSVSSEAPAWVQNIPGLGDVFSDWYQGMYMMRFMNLGPTEASTFSISFMPIEFLLAGITGVLCARMILSLTS